MAFPVSPIDGQTTVVNGINYVYSSTSSSWTRVSSGFVTISASGNITGSYFIGNGSQLTGIATSNSISANSLTGTVLNSGVVTSSLTSVGTLTSLSVSGNITGGNLNAAGLSLSSNVISAINSTSNITTTANISGGNIIGTLIVTSFSTTGNITGGNILTSGLISSTGNITGGNVLGGANVNATLHSGTTVSITGTVTAASVVGGVITGSSTSVTGAVSGASASVSGGVTAASVVGGVITGSSASVTGTVTGASVVGGVITGSSTSVTGTQTAASTVGGVITGSSASLTGNVTGGNLITAGLASVTGNITGGNVLTSGLISSTGNIVTGTNGFIGIGTTTPDTELHILANPQTVSYTVAGNSTTSGTDLHISGADGAQTRITQDSFGATSYVAFTGRTARGTTAAPTQTQSGDTLAQFTGRGFSNGTLQFGNASTGRLDIVAAEAFTDTSRATNVQIFTTATAAITPTAIATFSSAAGLSVAGNITGGNVLGGANVNATTHTGTTVSVSSTVTGGNIIIGVTGAYFTNGALNVGALNAGGGTVPNATTFTGSAVRVSGTNYNSVSDTGTIALATQSWLTGFTVSTAQAPVTYTNLSTLYVAPPLTPTTNVTITNSWAIYSNGAIGTSGLISATGNITGGNVLGGANVNATTHTGTTVSVTGNITGAFFVGNGSALTGITASGGASIINGTSNVVAAASGNVTVAVAGTNPVTTFASTGVYVPGLVSVTGNITGGNVLGGANVNATTHTGATVSVTGNITGGGLVGTIYTNSIINTGANATGNIGSATLYFNTVFAKATSAQYADLAEMYSSDFAYAPGTVVEFGGDEEITITTQTHSIQVAGIVSTNPSYLMNSTLDCEHAVEVALVGRVPCQVIGRIRKGDRLVASHIPGTAQVLDTNMYQPGCIVGKALENYDSDQPGTIEVAVGRI